MPRAVRPEIMVSLISFEEIISRAGNSNTWEVSWDDVNRRFILFTRLDNLSSAFYSPDIEELNTDEFFHFCEMLLKMTFNI